MLDESIAKEELQLKTATELLTKKYVQIRNYAVRDYAIYTGAECAGLLDPPPRLRVLGDTLKRREPPWYEKVLSRDITVCMRDGLAKTSGSLAELLPGDKVFFATAVNQVARRLEDTRRRLYEAYEQVPSTITEAQIRNLPSDSARVQLQNLISKLTSGRGDAEARRTIAIETERERIARQYDDAIRAGVLSLRSLDWPKYQELPGAGHDPDAALPITGYAEWNQEHKSFNLLKLDNGQFALQPNNRVLFFDQSLTPKTLRFPDFKTCTREFTYETGDKWSVGDTDTVMYDAKSTDT